MNRPKNRQPRPPRDQPRGGRGGGNPRNGTRPEYHAVPNKQQVVPGAGVFIVLKADQPTGRETLGVVQDLLTRGDHPRGIKVRLADGQVGRVQRMASASGDSRPGGMPSLGTIRRRDTTENLSEPPARSLADFLPPSTSENTAETGLSSELTFTTATASCPICGQFDGDELAVSRHVDEHFS
ncbi:uncharacterized protein CLAFUR5_00355 [Fulvia fulva]|uniref:UBZ4-type domain-containing protein n=1 Tax=Passalora fulva TaxID=5499 RepID=A0A9Q8L8D9_PASFU|nr:uncharacterized protein CLAFUR5_00355 [Fulvia fulva]KAK4636434.1 hypothetical protein CLAFUR0_00356 [Fulvia fulva]UJO12785.1 hypothetical protein CLAFUR5_00355 [Fulvia fulva]